MAGNKRTSTACSRGHPYVDGSHRWNSDGSRRCLVCQRMAREALELKRGVKKRKIYFAHAVTPS